MEGKLAITVTTEELEKHLNIQISFQDKNKFLKEALFNISPSNFLPVVTNIDRNSVRFMKWGLIPSWKNNSKNSKGLTSISLSSFEGKPLLLNALDKHCIVYVSGFYIWKNSVAGKIPYYITSKKRKLFGIAGMWECWETDDKNQDSFCLITQKTNGPLSYISTEWPVIIKEEKESEWLASTSSELMNEENFSPEYDFNYHPVNQKIIKSIENNPKFINRITYVVGEQTNLF